MQVYISFGILVLTVLLFGYLIFLARKLHKEQNSVNQSRAEITVLGMIGILILDYALTFPEQSSSRVFFFYGRTGIIIGTIIIAIAIISFIFSNPKKVL